MLKQILMAKMLFASLSALAMNGETLTLIVHDKDPPPCPLSFTKTINNKVFRFCVFTEIVQGNPDYLPAADLIISLAKDAYNEQPEHALSRIFFEMAEPEAQPIIFRLTIKLDILLVLQAL